jgi:hypothetical protein
LKGARFVTTVETDEGKQLHESLIKSLTGGDGGEDAVGDVEDLGDRFLDVGAFQQGDNVAQTAKGLSC